MPSGCTWNSVHHPLWPPAQLLVAVTTSCVQRGKGRSMGPCNKGSREAALSLVPAQLVSADPASLCRTSVEGARISLARCGPTAGRPCPCMRVFQASATTSSLVGGRDFWVPLSTEFACISRRQHHALPRASGRPAVPLRAGVLRVRVPRGPRARHAAPCSRPARRAGRSQPCIKPYHRVWIARKWQRKRRRPCPRA